MFTADVYTLCEHMATGLGVFDADLRLRWANPALDERIGRSIARSRGVALAELAPGLLDAAQRCLREHRRLHLREIMLGSTPLLQAPTEALLQPLADGALLLELPPAATAGGTDYGRGLRTLAHELLNPLAGMRGAAQLLERDAAVPAQRELACLIREEADRLAALVARLLRPPSTASQCAFDVHEPLQRIVALLAVQAGAPRVLCDYDPSLPPAQGDAERILQLLLNLARNAQEAGARTLILRTRAEIGTRLPGGHRVLRIEVHDDGNGVAPELRACLFEPWVSGHSDGTGLGLALARAIAREHGGELDYAPADPGSQFVLRLPQAGAAS
ncbi:MAG: ATP-binding protein [Metallibacterium scheffleri]|jgi:two-component system nitrogen regulation sensor histidine kinase GlnL|uniref:two-component system sensor histidine kinase NtrB n=1 Tax=Metallibacterium scheffleri TaxID=993689 RepID=UPI0026EC17E8|nr:ATP-binding protein [Metallibacterium scheffleri]MCK9367889.1 ATP-binding protein [Metallibacterium scheffleri]